MRLPLILVLAQTLAFGGQPLRAAELPADASSVTSPAEAQKLLDQIGSQLGEAQAKLDELEPQIDEISGQVKKNKYGGASNPEISGNYGTIMKDVNGFGLADHHGVGMLVKLDMSMLVHTEDGGSIAAGFGPVMSPGAYPAWVADDTDEVHKGTGTASRAGTLLGALKLSFHKGPFNAVGGVQSFQTSILTLSGPLSDRPILFDKNPYMTNITSKAYYENQFLTGVPKRSAEESEHYLHGIRTDLDLPGDFKLMNFVGNYEGYYDNNSLAHEYGGELVWDRSDAIGSKVKFIGYNRSNDTGEMRAAGGTPSERYFGLTNNTIFSVMGQQKVGPVQAEAEAATSAYADQTGIQGGLQLQGQALRLKTETAIGDSTLRLGAYSIGATYFAIDPMGKYNAGGANLLRYRDDPERPGHIIQQTVVADPTLPINNSTTYSIGSQLRFGNSFLNLNLQNSLQQAPTDARIWSAHYEGGSNLSDGTWFLNFNNNYQAWLPPSGTTALYNNGVPVPGLEREFFWNPRRDPPSAASPTTFQLNDYNTTYSPISWAAGSLGPLPGVIPDRGGKLYYHAYHQLETNLWRRNFEGIVNAERDTGLALSPSTKSISVASADLRMNVTDYIPLGRALYWQTYGELMTVTDTQLFVPNLDPWNLFGQSILDSTFIYNVHDDVVMLLNMGVENWVSDRMPLAFINNRGEWQKGILEYHDRQAGVGLDWNALPGKLNVYFRAKLVQHYDASAMGNSFQSRQMLWEMKTYF